MIGNDPTIGCSNLMVELSVLAKLKADGNHHPLRFGRRGLNRHRVKYSQSPNLSQTSLKKSTSVKVCLFVCLFDCLFSEKKKLF